MKKYLLLVFSICHLTSYTCHTQSIKYDYGVYPPPSPAPVLPAAGNSFTDPTFGTSILRVTDSNDGNDNHQSYSYWPSMNKNSSLLYISSVGGSPTLYDFDTTTFSVSNKRAMFASNPPSGTPSSEDAIWSGTQNNVMLCHTAQKIWSYNSSTNTYTLIKDFSSAYPDLYLAQMSRSINDDVFAFTYKENVNYSVVGYITYKVSTNQTDTANLAGLDEVQVDKSGNYLVVKTGNSGPSVIEVEIVNLQTGNIDYLTDNGTGFVIGADNWNNTYTFRTLANPHSWYSAIDFNNDWSLGNHVSQLSDDENWMLMSTFLSNTLPSSGIFQDEIFQFSTDGNKNVRRLAHTHSDVQNGNDAYWSSPRANISRDGKYAVFTSNWGSTTRMDVFVLKIPFGNATGVEELTPALKGDEKIELYNILGEKVFEISPAQSTNQQINLSCEPTGIYILKSGTTVRKILVTR